jgi:integrase/recombinase XerD
MSGVQDGLIAHLEEKLLRAAVPQKVIGDLLGHSSTEATIPYLKLATADLRAIALEVPGREVRP